MKTLNGFGSSHLKCLICGKSPYKDLGVSLHKFPSIKKLKNRWLKACNMAECDFQETQRLCSTHFNVNCYTNMIRKILKPKSVPTIFTEEELEHPWFKTKPANKKKRAVKTLGESSNEEKTEEQSPNEEKIHQESPNEKRTLKELPNVEENLDELPKKKKVRISQSHIIRFRKTLFSDRSVWVCQRCLVFLLSKNAARSHLNIQCEIKRNEYFNLDDLPRDDENENEDDGDENNDRKDVGEEKNVDTDDDIAQDTDEKNVGEDNGNDEAEIEDDDDCSEDVYDDDLLF